MDQPKRITGFMPLARQVVHDSPGLTAKEVYYQVARLAEAEGIPISAASNPQISLVATLAKAHKDFDLKREKGRDGNWRYYPVTEQASEDIAHLTVEQTPPSQGPPRKDTNEMVTEVVSQTTAETDLIRIPLVGDVRAVTLETTLPIGEESWDRMIGMLQALKSGWVTSKDTDKAEGHESVGPDSFDSKMEV